MTLTEEPRELGLCYDGNEIIEAREDDALLLPLAPPQSDGRTAETRFANISRLKDWIPRCDPYDKHGLTFAVKRRQRFGLLLTAFIISVVVFIANLVVLCVFTFSPRIRRNNTLASVYKNTLVPVYDGTREDTRLLNLSLHLAINILSTALLAASNLCMQLVTAPTRTQVRQAHTNNDYYDIGVLSFRNWWKAPWNRKVVSALLLLSSLPLHFV